MKRRRCQFQLIQWILFPTLLTSVTLQKYDENDHSSSDSVDSLQWTDLSLCSRTCGGGVTFQDRKCYLTQKSNRNLTECPESDRRYFLCNREDCPSGSQEFRHVQCSHFDNDSFDGKFYKWVPYNGVEDKCALICLAKGEQFYRRLAPKVIDGTPCERNSLDVCVDGTCQSVGCDKILGSEKVLDACLVCNGNDATCKTLHGRIETDSMPSGYNELIRLPEGATSISLQEEGTSKNYFAIKNERGTYYLNGNYDVRPAEELEIGGMLFQYQRINYGMEYLAALGPIRESLILELLKQPGVNPAVTYDYSILMEHNKTSTEVFAWIAHAWNQCNTSCGIGYLLRKVSCIQIDMNIEVDDIMCHHQNKPSAQQFCYLDNCTADWYIGNWQTCSETCALGSQVRKVFCQRTLENGYKEAVGDDHCSHPKPPAIQHCNLHVKCPQWEAGEWSQCIGVCGAGKQTRKVVCATDNEERKNEVLLSKSSCHKLPKPIDERPCDNGPCNRLEWMTSEWSGCPDSCLDTVETRTLKCSTKDRQLHDLSECDPHRRPEISRPCLVNHACHDHPPQWFTSQWSSCSKSCDLGIQRRAVFCGTSKSGRVTRLPPHRCHLELKPVQEKNCSGIECSSVWFTGPFGKCSAACDGGQRSREIFCVVGNYSVNFQNCQQETRPDKTEDCNQLPCDDDGLLLNGMTSCGQTLFGCCPDGMTPAEGPHFFGCPSSDSIPHGLCIDTEFGCCSDGITLAEGPFGFGCSACQETEYGCCPDDVTPAEGLSGEGCPLLTSTCHQSAFGCCPDGVTVALESDEEGCTQDLDSDDSHCQQTEFGCCPDGLAVQTGLNGEGCQEDIHLDFELSGSGGGDEGQGLSPICESSAFGCCPDGVTIGREPDGSDCNPPPPSSHPPPPSLFHCSRSTFGCCPDGRTFAAGHDGLGCHGVRHQPRTTIILQTDTTRILPTTSTSDYVVTTAAAPKPHTNPPLFYHTISTHAVRRHTNPPLFHHTISTPAVRRHTNPPLVYTTTTTLASILTISPNTPSTRRNVRDNILSPGATCDETSYGCCLDGRSTASGPDLQGCPEEGTYRSTCSDYPYGCCPDGVTAAAGPMMAQCSSLFQKAAICSLAKDSGSCAGHMTKWYYDTSHGDCMSFEYGGCDGNANRFDSSEQCRDACISPPQGIGRCYLAQSAGSCHRAIIRYSYNPQNEDCEEFVYSGCLGNENRFLTLKECQYECVEPQKPNVCNEPPMRGPCAGNYQRFYFDKTSESCKSFNYGGCKGNENQFKSLEQCEGRCAESVGQVCRLPMDEGPCIASFYQWFFNTETNQCQEFIYGGCLGNANRFRTKSDCEDRCRRLIRLTRIDRCSLSAETGPCKGHHQKWFYDPNDGYCKQFVYGGCAGNENRFDSEMACRDACDANPPIDVCTLPAEVGHCRGNIERFYFDSETNRCLRFSFGGCEGNENNFHSSDECQRKCSSHLDFSMPPPTSRCLLPRDPGPCIGSMILWHFSQYDRKCSQFEYGGCGGNHNRFFTESACSHECDHVKKLLTSSPSTSTVTSSLVTSFADLILPKAVTPIPNLPLIITYDATSSPAATAAAVADDDVDDDADDDDDGFFIKTTELITDSSDDNEVMVDETDQNEQKEEAPDYHIIEDLEEISGAGYIPTTTELTATQNILPTLATTICSLHADVGPCNDPTYRWHYDQENGQCIHFRYGGCQGNANNFKTKEICEKSCPVKEICHLVSDVGPCRAAKSRYYFDSKSAACQSFVYGGCQGNANRFLTLENCQRVCQAIEVEVEMNISQTDIHEEDVVTPSVIPLVVYARPPTASMSELTLSTPSVVKHSEVCQMMKDPGPCQDFRPIWYFEPIGHRCRRFYYGGCHGNANKFNSSEECHSRCLNGKTFDSDAHHVNLQTRHVTSQTHYVTPETHHVTSQTHHVTPETHHVTPQIHHAIPQTRHVMPETHDVTPQTHHVTPETHKVTLQPHVIPQTHHVIPETHQSTPDIYVTQRIPLVTLLSRDEPESHEEDEEDREEKPKKEQEKVENERKRLGDKATVKPDLCSFPKDTGPCLSDDLHFYWSADDNDCRPFIYGGCQGNDNNFMTEEECYRTCSPPESEAEREGKIHRRLRGAGDCFKPAGSGSCDATHVRWYFDFKQGDCLAFYYGGCQGNGNNFLDYEDCIAFCSKVSESCGLLQCDLNCAFGFVHGHDDGCPICQCLDPCQNHVCPDNMECRVENETCTEHFCQSQHQPVCRTNISKEMEPGSCPTWDKDTEDEVMELIPCSTECRGDDDCHGDTKCCSVGCSKICVQPQQPECFRSTFHCCPDGLTPAKGWNYRGCPEESPVIETHSDVISVLQHDDVLIPCTARAAPRPQITWFKNKSPILIDSELEGKKSIEVFSNGSLLMRDVLITDAAEYSCRAYNNIGADTRTYTIFVYVPVEISGRDEIEMIDATKGDTIQLICLATGHPVPSFKWLKDNKPVHLKGNKKYQEVETGLVIRDIESSDEGVYICRAENQFAVKEQVYQVKVKNVESLSLEIMTLKINVSVGEDLRLLCQVTGNDKVVNITWSFDGKPLKSDDRYKETAFGELLIETLKTNDTGEYSCTASKRGQHPVTSSAIFINVQSRPTPVRCVDKPWYANCQLIVEAGLCRHAYFSIFCCRTCHDAGQLP